MTFEGLVAAAKEAPETATVANLGIGQLWYVEVAMFEKAGDVKYRGGGLHGSKPVIPWL